MTLRPVIFDMDGVLADSEGISCRVASAVLCRHGAQVSVEEVRQRFVGMSTAKMLQIIALEQSRSFPQLINQEIREESLRVFENTLRPIPGMDRLIKDYRFPRCVASSSSPPRINGTLGLIGLLDDIRPHIFSATMVKNGKPAPDLFWFAAKSMGWRAEDCIVIEDSKAGVEAGAAAGMTVIGLTAGEHVDHEEHAPMLTELGAHQVVQDVSELKQTLQQLGVTLKPAESDG